MRWRLTNAPSFKASPRSVTPAGQSRLVMRHHVRRKRAMIRSFGELAEEQQAYAGGKGNTLARLYQEGFPVPDGFVILPAACRTWAPPLSDVGAPLSDVGAPVARGYRRPRIGHSRRCRLWGCHHASENRRPGAGAWRGLVEILEIA